MQAFHLRALHSQIRYICYLVKLALTRRSTTSDLGAVTQGRSDAGMRRIEDEAHHGKIRKYRATERK
jgi:hypothetical protein